MGLNYANLDQQTRDLMIGELEHDLANADVYLSPRLSDVGRADYVDLLRAAMRDGSDDSLAQALASNGRLRPRRTSDIHAVGRTS